MLATSGDVTHLSAGLQRGQGEEGPVIYKGVQEKSALLFLDICFNYNSEHMCDSLI